MQNLAEFGDKRAEEAAKTIGIKVEDVVETLKSLQLRKPWKGERLVLTTAAALDAVQNRKAEPHLPLIPELLDWQPENPLTFNLSTEKGGTPKQSQQTVSPFVGNTTYPRVRHLLQTTIGFDVDIFFPFLFMPLRAARFGSIKVIFNGLK